MSLRATDLAFLEGLVRSTRANQGLPGSIEDPNVTDKVTILLELHTCKEERKTSQWKRTVHSTVRSAAGAQEKSQGLLREPFAIK